MESRLKIMSSSSRWSLSLTVSLALNLLALCVLGRFWQAPPAARARAMSPPRFGVYVPPKPPPPDVKPDPIATPTPYDPATNPPVVPAAPALPPTNFSALPPVAMHLPLSPMPVTALTPNAAADASNAAADASNSAAPDPSPAVAAPNVTPALPNVTPEAPILTASRPDAPELAPKPSDPTGDGLVEPTLAPASGEGAAPGTKNGDGDKANGDGTGKSGEGDGKNGNGEGKSGDGKGRGGDGRGPFGIRTGGGGDGPRHVVYLLDVSLSMRSRIGRARAELHAALTNLQPDDRFDIVAFSGRVQPFDDDLVSVSDATVAQADYFLTTLPLGAGTNLEKAITRALDISDVNTVIILTDGEPTEGETDTKKLARIVKNANKAGAKIYAIGLVGKDPDGGDNSFEATQLLYEITNENGGDLHTYTVGVQTP